MDAKQAVANGDTVLVKAQLGTTQPNGISPDAALSNAEGDSVSKMTTATPPEIEHISQGFQPLSRLYLRVAQECFNSLNETITQLSSLADSQQVNGDVQPAATSVSATTSTQKKLQWLNFANTQREKFIKLLVLSQWSHQVEDVSMLIDIVNWTYRQEAFYEDTIGGLGQVKRDLTKATVPSPDLDVALEVLSTGASSRMPDVSRSASVVATMH